MLDAALALAPEAVAALDAEVRTRHLLQAVLPGHEHLVPRLADLVQARLDLVPRHVHADARRRRFAAAAAGLLGEGPGQAVLGHLRRFALDGAAAGDLVQGASHISIPFFGPDKVTHGIDLGSSKLIGSLWQLSFITPFLVWLHIFMY